MIVINDERSLSRVVTKLKKYTLYDFQVLAFTSVGDGPKSSVIVERTKEDGKIIKALFSPIFILCLSIGHQNIRVGGRKGILVSSVTVLGIIILSFC